MSDLDLETGAASERADKGQATAADHHLLAVHAYRKGDLARALSHNERSRELGAPVAAPAYLRGLVLREMGRLDEAARAFEEAADAADDRDRLRAKALSSLGAVLCLQGDPRAALEPLSRACWLRPDLRDAWHNLGVAAVRAHEWGVAASAFLRLAREDPGSKAQSHYLRLLLDVGRAAALDEMRAQGHRLKNVIGVTGDKARQLEEDAAQSGSPLLARAAELVNDVDELYRAMRSYLDAMREEPLELDLVDLNALVGRCLFALSPSFRDLKVERKLEPDLPEVVGDRASLEEVLTNIVRNAIEALRESGAPASATPPDGPADIEVSTSSLEVGRVAIAVRDRGKGLSPEDVDRIFLLGFTTKPRGSGIGLAQARKLVHAHGGEIEVECGEGSGAVFRIVLPTSPPPEPTLPRLDVRSPLFESLGDLELGQPE